MNQLHSIVCGAAAVLPEIGGCSLGLQRRRVVDLLFGCTSVLRAFHSGGEADSPVFPFLHNHTLFCNTVHSFNLSAPKVRYILSLYSVLFHPRPGHAHTTRKLPWGMIAFCPCRNSE